MNSLKHRFPSLIQNKNQGAFKFACYCYVFIFNKSYSNIKVKLCCIAVIHTDFFTKIISTTFTPKGFPMPFHNFIPPLPGPCPIENDLLFFSGLFCVEQFILNFINAVVVYQVILLLSSIPLYRYNKICL